MNTTRFLSYLVIGIVCQPQDNDDEEEDLEPAFPLLVRDKNGRTLDDGDDEEEPQQKKPASREEEYDKKILPEIPRWNPNFHGDEARDEVAPNTLSKPRDALTQIPISLT